MTADEFKKLKLNDPVFHVHIGDELVLTGYVTAIDRKKGTITYKYKDYVARHAADGWWYSEETKPFYKVVKKWF